MARINNPELYPTKQSLSFSDRIIGSDSEDNEETKNFTLQGVKNLFDTESNGTTPLASYKYREDFDGTEEGTFGIGTSRFFSTETSGFFDTTGVDVIFTLVDNNGIDCTALFDTMYDNPHLIAFTLQSSPTDVVGFKVVNATISSGDYDGYGIPSEFLSSLTVGTLQDGLIYNLYLHPYASVEGTDLSYDSSSREVKSSTGGNATLPYATSGQAGLLPRLVRQTFSPNIYDSGATATYTYTSSNSYYERIGNLVFFNVIFEDIKTVGTPSGVFRVGGMPFTINSTVSHTYSIGRFSGGDINFYSIVARSKGGNNSGGFEQSDITFYYQDSLSSSLGEPSDSISGITFVNGKINVSGFYPITFTSADYVG